MTTTHNRGGVSNTGTFVWNDEDPNSSLGPGLSRPEPGEKVRPYRLRVRPPAQPALTVTLSAATEARAIGYALRRWPGAIIEPLTT